MKNWKSRIIGQGEESPDQLLAHPNNWRIHPKYQQDALEGSLDEIGWIQQVIVNQTTGHVVDGHLRVALALRNEEPKIPVLYVSLTEEEEKKALAILDPITGLAVTDLEKINDLLTDVQTSSAALQQLMAEASGIDKILKESYVSDDCFEIEEPEKAKSIYGEIYCLGKHKLMCGDSTCEGDVSLLMKDKKADMMFTDPPYGVSYTGKTKDALTIESDDFCEEDLIKMCKSAFDIAQKYCRGGSYWIATVPPGPLHSVFVSDWKSRGILRQILVWVKNSMVLGHSEYHYKHEPILFGWTQDGERLKNDDRTKTSVWEFNRPSASREHPTMKPVEMWIYGITNHTKSGDLLYEPFCGSGTTIIACEKTGRACFAIEKSEKYCDVIRKRWAESIYGGGCDWQELTKKE